MKIFSLVCLLLLSTCAKERSTDLQVEALGAQKAKDFRFSAEELKAIDESVAKNQRLMFEMSSPEDQKILLQQQKLKSSPQSALAE